MPSKKGYFTLEEVKNSWAGWFWETNGDYEKDRTRWVNSKKKKYPQVPEYIWKKEWDNGVADWVYNLVSYPDSIAHWTEPDEDEWDEYAKTWNDDYDEDAEI